MSIATKLGGIAKAVVAAGTAFSGALTLANNDGIVTQGEWIIVVASTIGALGIVYVVPNSGTSTPKPANGAGAAAAPDDEATQVADELDAAADHSGSDALDGADAAPQGA